MRWRSWLRYCATSRKVAGSFPNGATGIFHRHNPSGRTMALMLTQPPTEMSTTNISWGGRGKGGRCLGLTTLPPSCVACLEIWEPQTSGTLRACPGQSWDCLSTVSDNKITSLAEIRSRSLPALSARSHEILSSFSIFHTRLTPEIHVRGAANVSGNVNFANSVKPL